MSGSVLCTLYEVEAKVGRFMILAKSKNSNASQLFEILMGSEAQNEKNEPDLGGVKWILCEDFLVMMSVLWSKFSPFETIGGSHVPGLFF